MTRACSPIASRASIRSSPATSLSSSRRVASARSAPSSATSASAGPRQSPSASSSTVTAMPGSITPAFVASLSELVEAGGIQLRRIEPQSVAGGLTLDAVGAEQLPQVGDVRVDRAPRRLRRLVSPDLTHQDVGRDQLVGSDDQMREDRPLLRSAELDRLLRPIDLQRSEDPEPHPRPGRGSGSTLGVARRLLDDVASSEALEVSGPSISTGACFVSLIRPSIELRPQERQRADLSPGRVPESSHRQPPAQGLKNPDNAVQGSAGPAYRQGFLAQEGHHDSSGGNT